jgi:hypothetical protein
VSEFSNVTLAPFVTAAEEGETPALEYEKVILETGTGVGVGVGVGVPPVVSSVDPQLVPAIR